VENVFIFLKIIVIPFRGSNDSRPVGQNQQQSVVVYNSGSHDRPQETSCVGQVTKTRYCITY